MRFDIIESQDKDSRLAAALLHALLSTGAAVETVMSLERGRCTDCKLTVDQVTVGVCKT